MASRSEDENSLDGPAWLPEEALKAIEMELHDEALTSETLAERYLIKNAPAAALSIANLSKHSPDPRVRLAASTYIVDKVLGRTGVGTGLMSGATNGLTPVEALMSEIQKHVEAENKK